MEFFVLAFVVLGAVLVVAVLALLSAINDRNEDEDDGHESILIMPIEPIGEQVDADEIMRRYG